MQTPPVLVVVGALSWLAACTSQAADPSAADGGASSSGGGGAGEPTLASCPAGPEPKTDTKPVMVGLVEAKLIDELGAPTSAGLVQVCGKDICINANVDDSGTLAQVVKQDMDAPACKYGDGREFGKLALPLAGGNTDLGTLTSVRLPAFEAGAPLAPGETVTSAGVSLTLAGSARIEVDTLTYEVDEERGFRAAALPEAALEPLNQGFVLGFALSPVETRICPSPALSIANTTKLKPGAELELYMAGFDVQEEWAPYAGWQKVGEGRVSSDGSTLDFPEGLPLLTAIGIREKP